MNEKRNKGPAQKKKQNRLSTKENRYKGTPPLDARTDWGKNVLKERIVI